MTDLESEESLPTFRSFLASSLLQVEQPLLLCVVLVVFGTSTVDDENEEEKRTTFLCLIPATTITF